MNRRIGKSPPKGAGIEVRQLRNGGTVYRCHFRVVVAGKKKQQSKQFRSLEEALAFRERFAPKGTGRSERLTIAEFINGYWQTHAEQTQKPSTLRAEGSRLKHYVLPAFGNLYLDSLSPAHWTKFLSTVQGMDGRLLSGKTKQNLFSLFHAVLQYAVELGMLEKNPIARQVGSRKNSLRPKCIHREKPILTPEQFKAILSNTTAHRRPLLWTFAITGLRASEIAGLKWADYDEQERTLAVRRAVIRGSVDTPKTEATIRRVGVPDLLASELHAQRIYSKIRLQRDPTSEDFIFCSPSGRPLNADTARREVLYPAMRKAGITPAGRAYGWHLFRHSAATAHLLKTGDIYRTSKYMGHASVKITESTYAHLKPAAVNEAELLQEYWAGFLAVPSRVPSQSSKYTN